MDAALRASIAALREDVADFWQPLSTIARVDASTLSPLQFYRQYVSKSVPVILTNAMHNTADWQHALSHWQHDAYLIEQAGAERVTVDVTPFGYGDAVLSLGASATAVTSSIDSTAEQLFVMPEEREMTFQQFLAVLADRDGFDGVPYLSHQNDSLREELPRLYQDVPSCIPLARDAFGNDPDAVNIWIGDERAVSTMHKDHYENMYCVVKGSKHFTLLPPADVACLYETTFPSMRYCHSASIHSTHDDADAAAAARCTALFHEQFPQHSAWRLVPSPTTGDTPWIPVDPLAIDTRKFPLAQHLAPLECVVHAGEMLYLPAMWYHRATQQCMTIAVNYWHDMDFDCKYVYYNFVHRIAAMLNASTTTTAAQDCSDNGNVAQDDSDIK